MKPMLAETASTRDLLTLCHDPRYIATQKVDGVRCLIVTGDARVRPLNRSGEPSYSDIPRDVIAQFAPLAAMDAAFDGEFIADSGTLYLFDMPSAQPYRDRREALESFFTSWRPAPCIKILPCARTTEEKVALALRVLEGGGEGVMFNRRIAPYDFGKRSTDLLKVKFVKDVDCVVTRLGVDGRQSMELAVYDGEELRVIGDCTVLAGDGKRVKPGDVVCVRYLYVADPNKPRLYQPTLPRLRHDKAPRECTISQLRFTNREVFA